MKNKYFDKNNKEIKRGDIVKISNSFCKCNDGTWLVSNIERYTNGTAELALKKISRNKEFSTAKDSFCYYPSKSFSYNVDTDEQQKI